MPSVCPWLNKVISLVYYMTYGEPHETMTHLNSINSLYAVDWERNLFVLDEGILIQWDLWTETTASRTSGTLTLRPLLSMTWAKRPRSVVILKWKFVY